MDEGEMDLTLLGILIVLCRKGSKYFCRDVRNNGTAFYYCLKSGGLRRVLIPRDRSKVNRQAPTSVMSCYYSHGTGTGTGEGTGRAMEP